MARVSASRLYSIFPCRMNKRAPWSPWQQACIAALLVLSLSSALVTSVCVLRSACRDGFQALASSRVPRPASPAPPAPPVPQTPEPPALAHPSAPVLFTVSIASPPLASVHVEQPEPEPLCEPGETVRVLVARPWQRTVTDFRRGAFGEHRNADRGGGSHLWGDFSSWGN